MRSLYSENFVVLRPLVADLVALAGGHLVADSVCFVRDRDAYSTTVAVRAEFLRMCVTPPRPRRFVRPRVDGRIVSDVVSRAVAA